MINLCLLTVYLTFLSNFSKIQDIYNSFFYFSQLMKGLMTKADNEVFAHYIFMDNEFFLPTATGVPLRIALSGTFTPGIKGGLNIASDMVKIFPFS